MMSWVAAIAPSTHLGRAYGWYTTALFCGMGLGPAAGGALAANRGFNAVYFTRRRLMAVSLGAVGRFVPAAAPGGRPAVRPHGSRSLAAVLGNRPLIGCWAATLGTCLVSGAFFHISAAACRRPGAGRGANRRPVSGSVGGQCPVAHPPGRRQRSAGPAPVPGPDRHRADQRVDHRSGPGPQFCALCSIAALALGASNALAFTAIGALIAETVAAPLFRVGMGGYNTCIYLGLMAGAFGLGPVVQATGFAQGFLLAGLANLPAAAFFFWSMRGYNGYRTVA